MKIFFRNIHLYLSLAAGLVILTACITGAILVFEKELQMTINEQRYYVTPQDQRLPLQNLVSLVQKSYPDATVSSVKIYDDVKRSSEISITNLKKNSVPVSLKADQKQVSRPPSFTVFINPYTGQILELYSYRDTFFYTVFALHRWLLGGEGSIGKYIVGVATAIFLFILITGLILWWPKTKKMLVQRLRIKSNSGWKRLNHDLHIVFGFYSAIFLFIIAFTGLAWSFEWFNKGIYRVTNSPQKPPLPSKSFFTAGAESITFDEALASAKMVLKEVSFYTISKPKDTTEVFSVSALSEKAVHESATDVVYIDQYSGRVAGQLYFRDRSLGAKVRATFKPVHTGSIGGTFTKIIALLVCLVGASFPVTGVIMWLNRIKKRKQPKSFPPNNKESASPGLTKAK